MWIKVKPFYGGGGEELINLDHADLIRIVDGNMRVFIGDLALTYEGIPNEVKGMFGTELSVGSTLYNLIEELRHQAAKARDAGDKSLASALKRDAKILDRAWEDIEGGGES